MDIQTINPSTGIVLAHYPLLKETAINACIEAAHASYLVWRKMDFVTRRQPMLRLAELLGKKQHEYSVLMAEEMGKPISEGKKEIEKCSWVCEHYANHSESYLEPRTIPTNMKKTSVSYHPLGVIFAIMPWNFPFWQVFRFAAPTIMAGNAAILKHAPISTGVGNAIAQLFAEADFPEHLFQHVILDNTLAATVIAHEKIKAVTLTGSERAGSIVGSNAVRHLKKVVLELGGNDPYVVLADADLTLAAQCIVTSRLSNAGQVCIAAKRIIVVKEVVSQLMDNLLMLIKAYRMGDPLDPNTNFGPMAREDLRQVLHQQILDSCAKGAHIVIGGQLPTSAGFYYPPTLLTNVKPGMPAFDDELFGPVIAIITADDEAHAISLANQSRYGLGAAVFTQDSVRGEHIATHEMDVGTCFVNAFVASDPRVPFGGIKCSGFGRELSREGILEFVNTKTVSVA